MAADSFSSILRAPSRNLWRSASLVCPSHSALPASRLKMARALSCGLLRARYITSLHRARISATGHSAGRPLSRLPSIAFSRASLVLTSPASANTSARIRMLIRARSKCDNSCGSSGANWITPRAKSARNSSISCSSSSFSATPHPSAGAVRRKGGGGGRVRTNPAFGGQPSRPQLGNSTRGAAGHLGRTCLAVDQVLHIGAPGRKWVDKSTGSGCSNHSVWRRNELGNDHVSGGLGDDALSGLGSNDKLEGGPAVLSTCYPCKPSFFGGAPLSRAGYPHLAGR